MEVHLRGREIATECVCVHVCVREREREQRRGLPNSPAMYLKWSLVCLGRRSPESVSWEVSHRLLIGTLKLSETSPLPSVLQNRLQQASTDRQA